jgi:hypothetical protein
MAVREKSVQEVADALGASGQIDVRDEARGSIPDYDSAIESSTVTVDQLIEATRLSRRRSNNDERSRAVYGSYLPKLVRSYRKTNGEIEESFVAQDIEAGALLLQEKSKREKEGGWRPWRRRRGRPAFTIHVRYPAERVALVTPVFEETLWRCSSLARRSKQLLRSTNARMVLRLMYSLIVYLLSVLDSQQGAPEGERKKRIERALATAQEHLDGAQEQYMRSAIWGAQLAYCQGMIMGLLTLLAVLAGIGVVGRSIDENEFSRILMTLGAGGVGALVSVMHRLTTDRLQLNHTAEHNSLRLLGAFRPLLGGILGFVVYVLISGDLLNISGPTGSPLKTLYFLAGIAFLAGFSERLAQDTLTQATPQTMGLASTSGTGMQDMEGSEEQRLARGRVEKPAEAQPGGAVTV